MQTTNTQQQGTVVAVKSTYVFVMCIIGIVSGALFGLGFLIGGIVVLALPNIVVPAMVGYILIALGVILGGVLLGFYIPQLVILSGCPQNLITRNGGVLTFWCGKQNGYLAFPANQIATVTPASGFWNSNLIMLIIGHYDAALTFSTSAGQQFKVPYVRDVKNIATEIQSICYQVKMQTAQPVPAMQAAAPASAQPAQPVQPVAQPVQPAAEETEHNETN